MVGDVALRVTKGTTPTTLGAQFVDSGINFVKVQSITEEGRIVHEKLEHIDEATNSLLSRSSLHEDDILFTIAGTIGRVALVSPDVLPANTNQAVAIVRSDPSAIHPRFLYYVLRDEARIRHAHSRVVQSVQANFSLTELRSLEIPLPPPDEQRAIAHVLGTLDDKIELNRRMSETLEEMARVLFRSWFVDFDPVRAKAAGRPSGLPPDLDALFPASLEASEPGEIPAGWEVKTLEDIFELAVGGAWGKDAPDHKATELVHCLRGIDCHALAEDRVPEAPVRWLTPRQLATRRLPPGTILIEGSGSFCGRSLLWSDEMSTLFEQPVTYSNFVKRLDRTGCSISQAAVVWQFMRRAYRDGEIQLYRTGTAFPNLDVRSLLSTLNVTVDPERCSASRSRRRSVCAPVRLGRQT